jgi:glycine cleavage system aminomethyltransferase T
VLLNEKGGIIDDMIITKHDNDAYYVVTNAGRRDRDLPWIEGKIDEWNLSEKAKEGPVEMEILENWGLLALQGLSSSRIAGKCSHRLRRSRGRELSTRSYIIRSPAIDFWDIRIRSN